MPASPGFAKLYGKLPARRGGYGLDVADRNIIDFEAKFPRSVPVPYLEFVKHFGTGPLLVKDEPIPWYVLLPAVSQDIETLVARELNGPAGQVILQTIAAFGALTTGTFTAMFLETCAEEPLRTADGGKVGRIGSMILLPMFEHPRYTLFWMWRGDETDGSPYEDIDESLCLEVGEQDLDDHVDRAGDLGPGDPDRSAPEPVEDWDGPRVVVFHKAKGRFTIIGLDFSDALAFLTLDDRSDDMEKNFSPLTEKAAGIRKHMDRALATMAPPVPA